MHLFFEDGDDAGGTGAGGDVPASGDSGAAAAGDAPAVSGDASGDAGSPPAVLDIVSWDGQAASLEKQPWWAGVPEAGRLAVTAGLQDVLKGWQRTYNTKLEEVATQRKFLDAARIEISELEKNWLKLVSGEDDPLKSRDDKITALEVELTTLKSGANGKAATDAHAAVTKARALLEEEKAALVGERDALVGERDEAKRALSEYAASAETAYREYLADWLSEHAPDLSDDGKEAALGMWFDLHSKGRPLDEALKATRAVYPAPPDVTKPTPPPDAIANMNMGDRATQRESRIGGFERARRETELVARWPGAR